MRWALGLICACGSGWMYGVVMRLAPLLPSAEPTAVGEVLPWVKPLTHHSIRSMQQGTRGFGYAFEYMGCCAGLFALYGVMLWLARRAGTGWFLALAAGASALFRGMLLCSPVMLSFDAYAYAYYGRLLSVYGANAHAAAPAASLADPFREHGLYGWGPSWYGPLWTVISAGVTWVGGGHVGLTLLMFRCLGVAASLGAGALIWVILKRVWPERAGVGVLLFLWNPVVVMESALAGHNDGFIMALVLLAVWLHLRGRKGGAVVALTLSALVKVITAPLGALYVLMALRECAGWRERGWFLARAGLGAAAAVALAMSAARMSPTGLLARDVSSASFYKNNYHDLVFKALRRALGESAATLDAPMDFEPWWVAASDGTALRVDLSDQSREVCPLKPQQALLALSAKDSEEWLRVYDPADRAVGFVKWTHLYPIAEPANAESDPVVRGLSVSPKDWPTVAAANRWIRLATWGLLAAFGLLAAWKTRDLESFLTWGTWYFLAAQLLVVTQLWPWYMIWALALGALKPGSPATRLAMMLSGGQALHYALLAYCNTHYERVFDYRSMFTVVLPVAAFGVVMIFSRGSQLDKKVAQERV
jgi:hypothetical protein